MATLNTESGSIIANCPGCNGGKSTFEWKVEGKSLGAHEQASDDHAWRRCIDSHRLFRCAGCGMGAFGVIRYGGDHGYPGSYSRLLRFFPEAKERLALPSLVPKGIVNEFREAERCIENDCIRAAAGLLRSVLDKTLRINGYKKKRESLADQIDQACSDGVITQSRRNKAHDEVRVLGNDVLHDDWHSIPEEDVVAARHYCQRLLEDFYDDRSEVEALLIKAGRLAPPEEKTEEG